MLKSTRLFHSFISFSPLFPLFQCMNDTLPFHLCSPLLSSLLLSSPLSSSPLLCSPMSLSPLLSSPLLSAQLNDTLSFICLFFTTFFSLIYLFFTLSMRIGRAHVCTP